MEGQSRLLPELNGGTDWGPALKQRLVEAAWQGHVKGGRGRRIFRKEKQRVSAHCREGCTGNQRSKIPMSARSTWPV